MKHLAVHEGGAVFTKTRTGRRYLTPREAAEYLGIGHSTLGIHRMNGTGPAYIKWGNNIRYDIEALDAWMAERAVKPEPKSAASEKRRVGRPRKVAVAQEVQ